MIPALRKSLGLLVYTCDPGYTGSIGRRIEG
jgi:hypothetical protein